MKPESIGVIVTFHREGILAHTTLRSYLLARKVAAAVGLDVRFFFIADYADEQTLHVLMNHPDLDGTEKIIRVALGDSALARNAGIGKADTEYLCILDGDDLISRNYFVDHYMAAQNLEGGVIIHPELVVSFGMYNSFNWQVDQAGPYFDRESLLVVNPWVSAAFARREVFETTPYAACYPSTTGFGYEDWYWNCETIAMGNTHRLAWGAAYFYRRKFSGSVNENSRSLNVVIPRTRLFSRPEQGR